MDELIRNLTIDVSPGRYGLVTLASLFAGITDAVHFKISNAVTLPLIVTGILYHTVFPAENGVLFTLLGAGTGFGILILFFALGGVGAGDVKLLAGIGAWIGPRDVLVVFIVAGVLNGLYSLAIMLWTRRADFRAHVLKACRFFHRREVPGPDTVETVVAQDEETRRRRLVPMGTMIALALIILLVRSFLEARSKTARSSAGAVPAVLVPAFPG